MDDLVIDSSAFMADELQPALQEKKTSGRRIKILNVTNHRFLVSGFSGNSVIDIYGDPGNCFANLLDGPQVTVHGDCEDDICDAMQGGKVLIHGSVGDIACQAMQGGQVLIKGDAGNRSGMQMREFGEKMPIMVIGGRAGDFLGEYMAGGVIIVLNKEDETESVGFNTGSGMIGGKLYIRGELDPERVGMNPRNHEILNYLSVHHKADPQLEFYRNIFEKHDFVPLQSIRKVLPKPESRRIHELFFEDVPELNIVQRPLTDMEIEGEVGRQIKVFAENFGFDPGKFMESKYTVITLKDSE